MVELHFHSPIHLHVIELNYINKDGDNFAFFAFTDELLSLLLAWLILSSCGWKYMFLRNVAELLLDYEMLHPRTQYASNFCFLHHYIKKFMFVHLDLIFT
jgi:hypothetical protein